jgi:hypothetical protein
MSSSGIFWITFNRSDIATAKQFMDSLKGDSTVDPLGLTRTMEAVSDILFPATSTLHKRIRYQIFVPAILLSMYRNKQRARPEHELARLEYQLQRTLIDSGEDQGVFGSSRGEALKYWPSMIYWSSLNALQLWGIEYLGLSEALELIETRHRADPPTDEGENEYVAREIEPTEGLEPLCRSIIPNGNIKQRLTFTLAPAEAKFFRSRFLNLFPNSLTSYILRYKTFSSCRDSDSLFDLRCPKNPALDNLLKHAKTYSVITMGAYYAYRWALCRTRRLSRNAEDANLKHFETWLHKNLMDVEGWRYTHLIDALTRLGGTVSGKGETEFVDAFLRHASSGNVKSRLLDLCPIVQKREEDIKGRNRSHFSAADLQTPKNVLGRNEFKDYYFDYRWSQGRMNLRDIFTGVNGR